MCPVAHVVTILIELVRGEGVSNSRYMVPLWIEFVATVMNYVHRYWFLKVSSIAHSDVHSTIVSVVDVSSVMAIRHHFQPFPLLTEISLILWNLFLWTLHCLNCMLTLKSPNPLHYYSEKYYTYAVALSVIQSFSVMNSLFMLERLRLLYFFSKLLSVWTLWL